MALVDDVPGLLDETYRVSSDVRHEMLHPFLVGKAILCVCFSGFRWFLAYEQQQGGQQAEDSVDGKCSAAIRPANRNGSRNFLGVPCITLKL